MNQPRDPSSPPRSVSLSQALQGSSSLAGLLQRQEQSRQRLAAVSALLPPPLRASVRAGPLDDAEWLLLVDNAAVAAKLRQLLPALQASLAEGGWKTLELKVKIQSPGLR